MQSTATVIVLLVFGHLRLWTYRALGKDFVYQLTRPSRLVTSGPYRYAQHSSYSTVLVSWFTLHASLARLDGVVGCFLPQVARVKDWAALLAAFHCAFWPLFLGWVIPPRVRDKEAMLKREYNYEWEKWSASTARFFPGID